ncbi:MAG: lipoprotein signal peptidase [Cyclobacteriaceae bacterium]|jgi:signal peptidase II|nr:lipoprotein signal peptidase [Cyclobacteriaceae bacterium]
MKTGRYFLLALFVIIVDQTSKLLVHHNMYLHQEINVIGDWFRLHYLLNPGMAFGFKWNTEFGKLALTVFRIVAMFAIGYYLYRMSKRRVHPGFLWCMGLILGGAVGNVIDSTFYGVLLNNHLPGSPTPWFHGQVIDMLFFPLFEFVWPEWVPFVGGDYFLFFSPVFNIADSAIFIGVVIILVMQKKFFGDRRAKESEETSDTASEDGQAAGNGDADFSEPAPTGRETTSGQE